MSGVKPLLRVIVYFSTPLRRPKAYTASSARKRTCPIGTAVVVGGGAVGAWRHRRDSPTAAAAPVERAASCATGCRHRRRAGVGADSRRDRDGGAAVRVVAAVGDGGGDGDSPPARTTGW